MFYKLFALFALFAMAAAAPNPAPSPQLITYTAGLDYLYPGSVPSVISPYSALSPYAYAGYPNYYVR
ncbi:unnamed protein product [Colias eurytheme]|nr:unnamed protein product [Colias eurytheme]